MPTPPTMQQPPWMAVAWAELGQSEVSGAAANPRVVDYFRQLGHRAIADDETAWCAAFVGACLERAGFSSTRSLIARSYLEWGEPATEPAAGSIAVLTRGASTSLGHVGFLVGMTDTAVYLLGGNQSDAVSVARFDRSRLLSTRMPTARATKGAATDRETFDQALAHVLSLEGGWSDDPFDPGGPTNKGITLADYARERRVAVTADTFAGLKAELRAIPDRLVRDIYLTRYWRPARCPDLPPPLALMHFDAAVNQGVSGAARMLQEALGVDIDGEIGPITLGAAHGQPLRVSIEAYADIRRRRYRSLTHFWRFGRGWLRRVDATLARSLKALPSSPSTQETKPMPDPQANFPSGSQEDAPNSKWWGQSMTIWGALLTALSTVLPLLGPILGVNLTVDLIERLGQDLVLLVQAAGGLIGTIMTILGRMRATTLLERRPVKLRL
ncbi:MAG: TIGR02594 family protein [Hyphomicrobiaceae bacterium]